MGDKLACLLCQRQFPSKEKLTKHNQLSELHKQNLEKWKVRSGSLEDANSDGQQYRDRARERRAKYGEADEPKPNKLKEKYMRAMQDVEKHYQKRTLAQIILEVKCYKE